MALLDGVGQEEAEVSEFGSPGWVQQRPLWGCIFVMVAGLWIWALTANFRNISVVVGLGGASGMVILGITLSLGLVCLFAPSQRLVVGALCLVTFLAALPLCNLGGFVIGTLLGVHGSALMLSFKPPQEFVGTGRDFVAEAAAHAERASAPEGNAIAD